MNILFCLGAISATSGFDVVLMLVYYFKKLLKVTNLAGGRDADRSANTLLDDRNRQWVSTDNGI